MINYNEPNINEQSSEGANGPVSVGKMKEYGKKAYAPLLNVVHKYQDEFTPYLDALSKGLQGGVDSLNNENSTEAEKYVSQFFQEASDGLGQACTKLKSKDINELSTYLSDLGERRPSIMFSTSYIAGIFFGRLARHVISKQRNKTTESATETETENFSPALDQSIH